MNTAENSAIILSFSGRRNGNCAAIARLIQQLTGGEVFSFADLTVHPCGRCEYECFQHGSDCPYIGDDVLRLYDAVIRSRFAYYILPNHCDFPNANFFAFNERSLCFFSGRSDLLDAYLQIPKKFIAVSGSDSELIRAALSQHAENPEILFLSAKAFEKKSIAGDLMTVPEAIETVKRFISQQSPID